MSDDLIQSTARQIRADLARNAVSPSELLDALESRIAQVDQRVNALPTLCFDRARDFASRHDYSKTALKGLPIAIKDLLPVAGVRTTWGSMIHQNHVPEESDLLVERLEEAGAIVYAKSNTPEFGAGANTFNDVFGITRNPWNTALSCAGSSGGSAVALATGMAWIASGSDLGGSLRNPASFCGIVGFRPSIGTIPTDPGDMAFYRLAVEGPMARNVGDVAMLLDVMAGRHPKDPISLPRSVESYESVADARTPPRRVAFSPDLGITPVDPEIAEICAQAARRFEDLGVTVDQAHPDFSGLQDVFQTLRALGFAVRHGHTLEEQRETLKPEIVWNIEKGLKLSADDITRAMTQRAAIYARAQAFFDNYDLLISPATVVPPYPVEQRYVEHLGEHRFSNYIEWCSIAYAITVIGAPAVSVPCGFTASGLPVGLQIAASPLSEGSLLSAAMLFEDTAELSPKIPIDPIDPVDPRPG